VRSFVAHARCASLLIDLFRKAESDLIRIHKAISRDRLRSGRQRSSSELRSERDYFREIKAVDVNEESLELAESLIAKQSSKLDLSKFEDGYELDDALCIRCFAICKLRCT
jgi:non-homologous end joining protein Ku